MRILGKTIENRSARSGVRGVTASRCLSFAVVGLLAGTVTGSLGCVSQGDFLRLQERVNDQHKSGRGAPDPFARIAQLSSEVDAMREEIRDLKGELELARKESADALGEIQRTRTTLAQQSAGAAVAEAEAVARAKAARESKAAAAAAAAKPPPPDQELVGYQEALDAWRSDDYGVCIEKFTGFLQNYPTSGYADDAAYWLATARLRTRNLNAP